MPIKVQNNLPAKHILESENIFVMDENRAVSQNIRPLKILILNLMPLKEDTELDLLRVLSNFPIQTEVTFMKVSSHQATHTSSTHLNAFYVEFRDIQEKNYDGMIITGAPVEKMDFSEVEYWKELTEIMDWTKTHVFSTFHICWGAQAGLFYHYGIQKVLLKKKLSGDIQTRHRFILCLCLFHELTAHSVNRHHKHIYPASRFSDFLFYRFFRRIEAFCKLSTNGKHLFPVFYDFHSS